MFHDTKLDQPGFTRARKPDCSNVDRRMMIRLQADLLRDLLDDLSDADTALPPADADAQPSAAAADTGAHSTQHTGKPQLGLNSTNCGATAPEAAAAVDARPCDSVGAGVLSLPHDVLLSVLRRCARADWLSLACACKALRVAADRDELWLSQPELQQPASLAAASTTTRQPAAWWDPSGVAPRGGQRHAAAGSGGADTCTARGPASTDAARTAKRKGMTLELKGRRNDGPGLLRPPGDSRPSVRSLLRRRRRRNRNLVLAAEGLYLGVAGTGADMRSPATQQCLGSVAGRRLVLGDGKHATSGR